MKKKAFLLVPCFALILTFCKAQIPTTSDCLGAIPICTSTYSEQTSPVGPGNYPDETDAFFTAGCVVTEENSIWYSFTVSESGDLEFTITPNDIADDYDWMMFDMTNSNCEDITSEPSIVASCNTWGSQSFIGGINGPTGISTILGGQGNSNGPGEDNGPPFNQDLPVNAGNQYVLVISNHSGSTNGYEIEFMEDTNNAVIYDNIEPELLSIDNTISCGTNQFEISFSEGVSCTTVSEMDFTITGPSNLSVTNVFSSACTTGASFDNNYTLTLNNPILVQGNYELTLNNSAQGVEDPCGNTSTGNSINFSISQMSFDDSNLVLINEICNQQNGSITGLQVIGGNNNLSYSWDNSNSTAIDIQNLSAGNYQLTVDDGSSCSIDTIIAITNSPGVTIDISNIQIESDICLTSNGSISGINMTSGTLPYSYNWLDTQNISVGNSGTLSGMTGGDYLLTVSDANNCFDQVQLNIPILVAHQFDFTSLSLIEDTCGLGIGNINDINATGGLTPYSYSWEDQNGTQISTSQNLSNVTAGSYILTISDQNSCSIDTTISLNEIVGPNIDLSNISTTEDLCNAGIGSINGVSVSGGNSPYNFSWIDSNNQTVSSQIDLLNFNSGNYILNVVDASGCNANESFNITNHQLTIDADITTTNASCNTNDGLLIVQVNSSEYSPFQYSIDNGSTYSSLSSISNLSPGLYDVMIQNSIGCIQSYTNNTIHQDTPPITFFSANQNTGVVPLDISFTNESINASEYLWIIDSTVISSDQDLEFQFNNGGIFMVELFTMNGLNCIDSHQIEIIVLPEFNMYLPTAFTPNNDGINDLFEIHSDWPFNYEIDFYIFNRWGSQLYHGKDLQATWDGTSNQQKCQQDVYPWKLVIEAEGNKRTVYTGSVTLIR